MMLNQMPAPIVSGGGNFVELEQITNVETAHAWMFMSDGDTVESISRRYSQWTTVIVISFGGSTSSVEFKLPDGWTAYGAFRIYQYDSMGRNNLFTGRDGATTFRVTPVGTGNNYYDFAIVSSTNYDDGTVNLEV